MKFYDFAKITAFIEQHKNQIASVTLGMYEDWWWTAETIWENGNYRPQYKNGLHEGMKVAGLDGSIWATPAMLVKFKDGTKKCIACYKGQSDLAGPPPWFSYGELSGPAQNYLPPLEEQ